MSQSGRNSASGGRSSEVERIIAAAEVDTTFAGKKAIRYRGRRSTWPGALALILVAAGSIFALVWYGIKANESVTSGVVSDAALSSIYGTGTVISDGHTTNTSEDVNTVNPEEFPDNNCEQPDYVSKNGKLYAVFDSGKQVEIAIKGVNWMGMQDKYGVPKGLWDSTDSGSTIYRVGEFLYNNNFNVVRLPLAIDSAMRNIYVNYDLVNTNSNRALTATRYNSFLAQIVQGLGQFGIGVVLDFHILSYSTSETGLWYGTSIEIGDIQTAISNLATEMCDSTHYNVIGIDLKDGLGTAATWGDESDTDWAAAATTLGNYVLEKCPSWVAFIQGIEGSAHKDTYGDRSIKNQFPAGSDLSNVNVTPISLDTTNKVVYSPKYWSSTYLPQPYFFDSGTADGDMLEDYVESSNDTLKTNVLLNMDYMFGNAIDTGAAVVLSSFGGLMGDADLTEMKTSQRIVEILIDQMQQSSGGLAGGFWYALNPETYWSYPLPDNATATPGGLVEDSWRAANHDVLDNLVAMDSMSGLNFIPCVN